MTFETLLPPHATDLERAFEQATCLAIGRDAMHDPNSGPLSTCTFGRNPAHNIRRMTLGKQRAQPVFTDNIRGVLHQIHRIEPCRIVHWPSSKFIVARGSRDSDIWSGTCSNGSQMSESNHEVYGPEEPPRFNAHICDGLVNALKNDMSPFMDFEFHHVAIIVSDYEASKIFYTETLGLEVILETYREGRQSWKLDLRLRSGGQLEIFSFPTTPDRPTTPEACGLRHLAFRVTDLDEAIRELLSKGVVIEPVRIDDNTGSKVTFFADSDGLPIEL
jgi:glyoxylase I family protein